MQSISWWSHWLRSHRVWKDFVKYLSEPTGVQFTWCDMATVYVGHISHGQRHLVCTQQCRLHPLCLSLAQLRFFQVTKAELTKFKKVAGTIKSHTKSAEAKAKAKGKPKRKATWAILRGVLAVGWGARWWEQTLTWSGKNDFNLFKFKCKVRASSPPRYQHKHAMHATLHSH